VNEVLARAGIFQGIAPGAVDALARHLQHVAFPRRRTVFVEGELGDDLYVILSGAVKIRHQTADGRETVFAVLGPGDVFGELALFDPGPRTSTVITLTEVKAVRMDRHALRTWIVERPEIAEQLLRVLARRLRHTNNTLSDLIFTDVLARNGQQSAIRLRPTRVDPTAGQSPHRRPTRETGPPRKGLTPRVNQAPAPASARSSTRPGRERLSHRCGPTTGCRARPPGLPASRHLVATAC
jgi:CRP-like cAMP-binding protein